MVDLNMLALLRTTVMILILTMKFSSGQVLIPGSFILSYTGLGYLQINFESDGSFNYVLTGHMMHDESRGLFLIHNDTIFLHYEIKKRSTNWVDLTTSGIPIDSSGTDLTYAEIVNLDRHQEFRLTKLLMIDQSNLYALEDHKSSERGSLTSGEYYLKRESNIPILPVEILLTKKRIVTK